MAFRVCTRSDLAAEFIRLSVAYPIVWLAPENCGESSRHSMPVNADRALSWVSPTDRLNLPPSRSLLPTVREDLINKVVSDLGSCGGWCTTCGKESNQHSQRYCPCGNAEGGVVKRDIIGNESSVACRLIRPPVTMSRRLDISQGAPIVKASGSDTKSFQRFDDCDAGNG